MPPQPRLALLVSSPGPRMDDGWMKGGVPLRPDRAALHVTAAIKCLLTTDPQIMRK